MPKVPNGDRLNQINEELKEIDLETARIKLAKERLALLKDLNRTAQMNTVLDGVARLGGEANDLVLRTWTTAKVVFITATIWIAVTAILSAVWGEVDTFMRWQYVFGYWLAYAAIPIAIITLYYGIKQWMIWPQLIMKPDRRPLEIRVLENLKQSLTGFWAAIGKTMAAFFCVVGGVIIFSKSKPDPSDVWAKPLIWAIWIASVAWLIWSFVKKSKER